LIILIASVPVALPTTFTVAQAVGALELSRGGDSGVGHGVLVTRLSAVQEGASMDVLCTDKTGTLTCNQLTLEETLAYSPFDRQALIDLAGIASDESGQDPIDLALLRAAGGPAAGHLYAAPLRADGLQRLEFTPFDPSTKRTEAVIDDHGRLLRVVKGMPQVVAALCAEPPESLAADVDRLAAGGARVLAVAAGPAERAVAAGLSGPAVAAGLSGPAVAAGLSDPAARTEPFDTAGPGGLAIVGLVALADRPREDSARLVSELRGLGIDVKMVSGDTPPAAASVASQVGIGAGVCTGAELRERPELANSCSVFGAVFPEDKYTIVRSLQQAGHVVGMTGDGVNDAPALKQAEVGIAVDSAVDVAKSAASMVLTDPGLVDIVAAVTTSRRIYQRMMTWTLNKIIKTAQVAVFLTVAFVITRNFVTTPLLVVLLLLANDFVTMSLAVDHARPSPRPERWRVGALIAASLSLATVVLAESFFDLWLARGVFHMSWPQTQTLMFLMLVFTGQATVYVVRERDHFWRSRPVVWLLAATCADVAVVTTMAISGILMTPVAAGAVAVILVIAVLFMLVMDPVKVAALRRFDLV
jgi:H+-transporting ATPase